MPAPWLSVVVPAYREEAGIAATVVHIRAALDGLGRGPWELIVVDNASPDGTAEALAPIAVADPRVRVLRNASNRGKGYSVRRGMLAATGDLRLHCDADCGSSFESLPRMLELIETADVVVGSRLAAGARVERRQPLRRRIVGRAFVELCRAALGEPIHDLYCGFKLWRAPAAEAAYARTRLDGWVFDAEVLALARGLGFRTEEAGVTWNDRDGSRLSMAHALVPVVRDLVRARRHVRGEAERWRVEPVAAPAP